MSYTDFETKKTFVKQLGRLISTMYPQIAALEYHQHEHDEVVIIRHQDGYTTRYVPVCVKSAENLHNCLRDVHILSAEHGTLRGELA